MDKLKIQIDPLVDTFLLDHVVAGASLLPTVMQLDLAARALSACGVDQDAPAGILLRDIVVGAPVRFDRPGPRELHLVYPPFFHGATFAVVGKFGRSAAGLFARLATGLPPLRWAAAGTVLRPRLLELLLQCCGLWELADSGRMIIPAAIERVHWHPDSLAADPGEPALACVVPRSGPGDGSRVFDGQVLGPDGSVLVTVAGYRTTDLGLVPDLDHATRLRRCLKGTL